MGAGKRLSASWQARMTAATRAVLAIRAVWTVLDAATACRRWIAIELSISLKGRCGSFKYRAKVAAPSALALVSHIRSARREMDGSDSTTRTNTAASAGTNRSMFAPGPVRTRSLARNGCPRKRAAAFGDADSNMQEQFLCTVPRTTNALPAGSRRTRCEG